MNSLRKVLLRKIEINSGEEKVFRLFERYYRYFKDFEDKADYKFKLKRSENPFNTLISFDFYLRENIFPFIDDFFIFHSSSISDGRFSFLIGGRAGSGKSILTFMLSKRYIYASDDITPVFSGKKILSFPYPQPISIYKDFKKFIDDEEIIEERGFDKLFVFPKKVINEIFSPVKLFIFPIPSKRNRVEMMKKNRAILYLSGIFINSKGYIKKGGLKDLIRIAENIPFYKIFWKDIEFLYEKADEIIKKF